ncbi:MAG: outer membrane beta-barrel protein [Acidobacteriota bacterium]
MITRTIILFVMILSSFPLAFAQEEQKFDIFIGYSYMHTDLREHCCTSKGLHGGSVSVAYNVNSTIGIVGDLGVYKELDWTRGALISFMSGVRISFPRISRMEPYVQGLLGGTTIKRTVGGGYIDTDSALGMAAGGGMDISLTKHISLRLLQAEYLNSPYREYMEYGFQYTGNFDRPVRQNHLRFSSGINFHF